MTKKFIGAALVAIASFAGGSVSAATPGAADQQVERFTRQEKDSIAGALATMWGGYFKDKAAKDGKEVTDEYLRGLAKALEYGATDDAFCEGLAQGMVMNNRLRQVKDLLGAPVDRERLLYYITRAANGRGLPFTRETADAYMRFMTGRVERERNLEASNKNYLDEMAKHEGVDRLPSGLLFEVITEGEGDMPKDNDMVLINYAGKLTDGTVFNATKPGEPVVFRVNETIAGFREGLTHMKRGGKYRLTIPPALGYGDDGVAGKIAPNSVIIFEVELIDFRSTDEPDPRQGQNEK